MQIIVDDNSEKTKVLRTPAKDVSFPLSQEVKTLAKAMKDTLFKLNGVGLAAPQVGVSLRMLAIYIPKGPVSIREHATLVPMTMFFNASYEPEPKTETVLDWEACYSVSDIMGKVPRYFKIRLYAQDEQGEPLSFIAHGHYARVLQHEIDHTNGQLCHELMIPYPKGSIKDMTPIRRSELSLKKQRILDQMLKK